MNCNIIKDLLPSYIDEICSQESVEAVEEHLKNCVGCKRVLTNMKECEPIVLVEEEIVEAKKPFKKLKLKKIIQLFLAVVLTFVIGIPIYQVTLKEPVLNLAATVTDYIFPAIFVTHVPLGEDEWQLIQFEGQDYFAFDSIFSKKKITNHANNEEEITIRVKDREGEIIIEELTIQSGTFASLQELKLFVNYQLEIKKPTDNVLLCIY